MLQPVLAAYAGAEVSRAFMGDAAMSQQAASHKSVNVIQPVEKICLKHSPGKQSVALPDLLHPERLDALLLNLYGAELMPSHLPVLVSQWAKYYFMQIIPVVLSASLLEGRHYALHLDQVSLVLDERGLPVGIRFAGEGVALTQTALDPFQRFAGLLDDNLQPFINTMSRYGGLASRVLWSSAGDTLETCLTGLAASSKASLAAGLALLAERKRPDGRLNPLYHTVTYIQQAENAAPRRQRKACCLSYQVEWVGRCEHCPRRD
ncbi:siderophore-iron reductase FhuF [Pseudomonas alliivorans]|uniref:siderophore-iron reductase FhuF n=1 Tax=Pseudomonas alliivorans TaxID=2810613 RepID=UPI0020914D7A|nr:siderophore-iron reductase FhuF [Pseudomonas alliivorans]MCO5365366.1 siderophore-iron reductase FhuF [Pseudomonas alliivorans]MEE4684867.1 siderophore-iron reductase FhuF [Pseudomonas alliivorans]MEE4887571.1 siderophore-iron reductase FhuF [Pseudomonas alliivorans]MEE5119588.1 siderophore-iron reductase FhuF [Pseudomonas alliivorans]